MIIDAHVHVWKFHSEPYPWQPLTQVLPNYEWPIEHEIEVLDKFGIDKAVLIQPSIYGFDNRYLLDCSQGQSNRFRSIGLVNPQSDTVEVEMESLAGQGLRGLRLAPLTRPDISWYNERRADRIWQQANHLNLVLTLLIRLDQVNSATQAIKRFPEVKVIIDHLARPDTVLKHRQQLWKDLLTLADFEQVYLKISAMGFMSQEPYPHHDILAQVRQVFDAFGPDRLMWGTDTPISQDPTTLPKAIQLLDLALPSISAEARSKILGGTAAQLFGWT